MADSAYHDLHKSREELADAVVEAVVSDSRDSEQRAIHAIESAMATVSELRNHFTILEGEVCAKVGGQEPTPEDVQLYLDAMQ